MDIGTDLGTVVETKSGMTLNFIIKANAVTKKEDVFSLISELEKKYADKHTLVVNVEI